MVNQNAKSLLAQFASDDFDIDQYEAGQTEPLRSANRFANVKRQQPSRTRFETQARYSRRRPQRADTPRGPRRRFRQPNGL